MKTTTAAIVLSLLVAPAFGQSADAPISTAVHPEEGEYLVSGSGFALYMFKADTQGTGTTPPHSACENDCLGNWPPLTVEGAAHGDGNVRPELLGTFQRSDGSTQVTYNGWPLYYYVDDLETTDIKGHDIEEFGEDWYLLGPHGNRADKDGEDDSSGRGGGGDDKRDDD